MHRTARKGAGGFTLFEIMIAISIFATVASLIFASYTGTFRLIEETESRAGIYEMAHIALERIRQDLESAYGVKKEDDPDTDEDESLQTQILGENKDLDGRDADGLRFFSRAHVVLDEKDQESGVAEILYDVTGGGEDQGLILYRTDRMVFEGPAENDAGRLILCDGLESVDFTYFDRQGEEHEAWDSGDEEFKDTLPSRVTIILAFVNAGNPELPLKFMTSVAVPMARVSDEKAR